jgi:hypothetical protein
MSTRLKRLYERICEWLDRSEWLDKIPAGGIHFTPKEKYKKIVIRLNRAINLLVLIGFCIFFPLLIVTGCFFPTMMIKGNSYYIDGFFWQGNISHFLYILFWVGFIASYIAFAIALILLFFFYAIGDIGFLIVLAILVLIVIFIIGKSF